MKILRFEDLKAWKAARELAALTTRITDDPRLNFDLSLRRQVAQASTSVMANIAEGFKAGSDREFIRFLKIARRSAAEVQSHLYVLLDRGYIKKDVFDKVYRACEDANGLIGGFIRYLSRPRCPTPPIPRKP